jgi:hypothetical protein
MEIAAFHPASTFKVAPDTISCTVNNQSELTKALMALVFHQLEMVIFFS